MFTAAKPNPSNISLVCGEPMSHWQNLQLAIIICFCPFANKLLLKGRHLLKLTPLLLHSFHWVAPK
jgi:hypothetical protein